MTGNQLKIIALLAMTIDHIGAYLLPSYPLLRVIGRLAFPIFAYMIAEGCYFTRNKKRYVGLVLATALVCQLVYWVVMQSLYQTIFTTLALSILTIYAIQYYKQHTNFPRALLVLAVFIIDALICTVLPQGLGAYDFHIDYGFAGVLLPVFAYLPHVIWPKQARDKLRWHILASFALGLIALCLSYSLVPFAHVQWWSLFALLLLALYNGKRGTLPLKYLFYVYYPAHLAIIWLIGTLL